MDQELHKLVNGKTKDFELAREVCLLSLRGQLALLDRLVNNDDTSISDLMYEIDIKINYYTKI